VTVPPVPTEPAPGVAAGPDPVHWDARTPPCPPAWYVRARRQRGALLVGALALAGLLVLAGLVAASGSDGARHREALPAEAVAAPPPLDPAHAVTHPDYDALAHPTSTAWRATWRSSAGWRLPPRRRSPIPRPASAPPPDAIPSAWRELLRRLPVPGKASMPRAGPGLLAQAADWERRDPADRARGLAGAARLGPPAGHRACASPRSPVAWQQLSAGERHAGVAGRHGASPRARSPSRPTCACSSARCLTMRSTCGGSGPALGPGAHRDRAHVRRSRRSASGRPCSRRCARSTSTARRNLALLAPRLGEADRANLRRALMATPASAAGRADRGAMAR
jgi:hypothetical protein